MHYSKEREKKQTKKIFHTKLLLTGYDLKLSSSPDAQDTVIKYKKIALPEGDTNTIALLGKFYV